MGLPATPVTHPPRQASEVMPKAHYVEIGVVAYFKSTGEGWQSRKDDVLRRYVARPRSA